MNINLRCLQIVKKIKIERETEKMTGELITHCLKFHLGNKSSKIIRDYFIISNKGDIK